jgi:hypothetical protein
MLEAEIRRIVIRSQPRQLVLKTLTRKYPKQKRAGGVTQVVELLPSNCEALSITPIQPKQTNKNVYVYINTFS